MNIVAFSSGSFIALFSLEAFTPLEGLNERRTVDAIRERYRFANIPDMRSSRAELEQSGIVFEQGVHETKVGQVAINKLSIHNDGVVVRSNKTEYAEAFFNDVISWLIEEHGCRQVRMKSLYVSEIVVDFEKPLSNLIEKYKEVARLIVSNVDESRGVGAMAINALSFEFVANDSLAIAKFLIERRVGTNVEDERYFCSAPLTTERHVDVLRNIESLFSDTMRG